MPSDLLDYSPQPHNQIPDLPSLSRRQSPSTIESLLCPDLAPRTLSHQSSNRCGGNRPSDISQECAQDSSVATNTRQSAYRRVPSQSRRRSGTPNGIFPEHLPSSSR